MSVESLADAHCSHRAETLPCAIKVILGYIPQLCINLVELKLENLPNFEATHKHLHLLIKLSVDLLDHADHIKSVEDFASKLVLVSVTALAFHLCSFSLVEVDSRAW